MANTYGLHAVVRVHCTVSVNETLTDPNEVTLHLRFPDGSENGYTFTGFQVEQESTGKFFYDIESDQVGVYSYQFQTAGGATGGSPMYQYMVGETWFE